MTQNNIPGSICAEEYVVKRGDSFYLIAHKLGVPLRDLLAANRDIHPARLMVGDVLCIPREEDDSVAGGDTSVKPENGGSGSTGSGSTGGTGGTGGSTGLGGSAGSKPENGGSTGGSTGSGGSAGSKPENGGSTGGSTGSGGSAGSKPESGGSTGGTGSGGSTGSKPESGGSTGGGTQQPALSCPVEEQFTIQKGQTVSDIQLRNLLSLHTLEEANPDVDLESLRVGQTICVPSENIPCPLPRTYTLTTSETLEAVAVHFNLPVASLLRANPCLAPQDFEAGVTISLPN